MGLRSLAEKSIKRLLALSGYVVARSERFGIDPFSDITKLAEEWGEPLRVFFDVGANDGGTAEKALCVFPAAKVFSFEPHPRTFKDLTAKVSSKRFHSFNLALGAKNGKVELFEYDNSYVNSLVPNAAFAVRHKTDAHAIQVNCDTVDNFCRDHSIESIDVLKIDTEGFDLVVLEGAAKMLRRRSIRFIYFEFNDLKPVTGIFGGALIPFDDLLRPFGYRFIATYNDYLKAEGELFSVSNALYALPPNHTA